MLTRPIATNALLRGAEVTLPGTWKQKGAQQFDPRQGEVWQVELGDTVGTEMCKTRPVVVLNMDEVRSYTLRLVAPITGWQSERQRMEWHTRLKPNAGNGLTKESSVDAMNLRCADVKRFVRKIGRLSMQDLNDVTSSVLIVVGRV